MNELQRWANFYLLISAAAPTLIGLLFVVITLGAERSIQDDTGKLRLDLTPTVLYFSTGALACFAPDVSDPRSLTASLCICFVGVGSLVNLGSFLLGQRHKKNYYGLQDRIVYAMLPSAAYGLHILGGALFFQAPQRGLTLVAAGRLSLIALAIRNSWAIAVDLVSRPRGRQQ